MQDRRRHPRIRFGHPPAIRLGMSGATGEGLIENVSTSGLMLRTDMELPINHVIGVEFVLGSAFPVDVPANVISRVGDLYCLRFRTGPLSYAALDLAIDHALSQGIASTVVIHEIAGKRVMCIAGGLNDGIGGDFMHALTRVGIDEIDLSEVTAVDRSGLALCTVAKIRHRVHLGPCSECFTNAWRDAGNA